MITPVEDIQVLVGNYREPAVFQVFLDGYFKS